MTEPPGWQPPGGQPVDPPQPAATNWPPPSYPVQPGYGPPPMFGQPYGQARRTNAFAITALVLGILPGAVLAIVFGVLALRQIRRTGDRGKGMAIAGIVLGGVWTLLIALAILGAIIQTQQDQAAGIDRRDVTSLQVGDCTADFPMEDTVFDVPVVPCDRPHRFEVYANLKLDDGKWPGEDAIHSRSEKLCGDKLDAIVGDTDLPDGSGFSTLEPTRGTWSAGDRQVTCLLSFPGDRSGRVLPTR